MPNQLGSRIAALRARHGFTQQELADRLAISRTAVSHLEAGISLPSERTVTLLAGLFKIEPMSLIEGTSYPAAKAERLPSVACCYTEAELQARMSERDCAWLRRLQGQAAWSTVVLETCKPWFDYFEQTAFDDEHDKATIAAAKAELEALYHAAMRQTST